MSVLPRPAAVAAFLRRLPVQLIALLTLALFPLGLISLYQTANVLEEARALNRLSLMERTVVAGTAERELIQNALGAAQGLGAAVLSVPIDQCQAVMTRFVEHQRLFRSARFHAADGRLICQSEGSRAADAMLGVPPGTGLSDVKIEPEVGADGHLIRVTQPVGTGAVPDGYVSITFPVQLANALITDGTAGDGLRIAVVNREGALLAASHGQENAGSYLPRELATDSLFELQGFTFDAPAGDGSNRVFAVSPMIEGRAALVGSWPQQAALSDDWTVQALAPMVFPVLMWLIGLLVAYLGLQRLVIRHVTALRSAMRRYALGELRGGRITLDNPPEELRETERAFNRMVLLLAQADAQQEQNLRDKEVLLKEIHHRVKNNLQLIGSIMNMQSRQAQTPEARRILASLQTRVRGLATMHRTLYSTPEGTTVEAASMLRTLMDDIAGVSAQKRLEIETQFEPLHLFPDQAVPLSMLFAEAMTNAVKYGGRGGDARTWIRVAMRIDASETVTLEIENSLGAADEDRDGSADGQAPDRDGDGLGTTLIRAFERQLGGSSTIRADEDSYLYSLTFPRRDFEAPKAEQTLRRDAATRGSDQAVAASAAGN